MIVWDHWHIEVSSICALQCPRCPRAEVPDSLLNRQLDLDFFQTQISAEKISQIKKITFCGNDGDPIYCRDFVDICRWIKKINPDIALAIITNGSHRNKNWWKELAAILDHRDEIHWSLDGWDQHSNQQYRINSRWDSITQGIDSFFQGNNSTYRVWDTIAFRFNEYHLADQQLLATHLGFDQYQLTRSTKFGSKYPDSYGRVDLLEPMQANLVSSTERFQREHIYLSAKQQPGQDLKEIFWQRAQELDIEGKHSGICLIGNKGVFINSRGEFYPCCWTANRYAHNSKWHDLAQSRFNLWNQTFDQVMQDPFWKHEFLRFESQECQTKCTREKLKLPAHATEW